jgi:hypothetical protein
MAKNTPATAADPAPVTERWQCPVCHEEHPTAKALAHLGDEVTGLQARLQHDVRTDVDELGNVLAYGPGQDTHPAVWLRFRDIIVDPSVQRGRQGRHMLFRRGVDLDPNKTEAISIVPVYAPGPDGEPVLIGYRAVEGQHRTLKGQEQTPDLYQLCKILHLDSRQDESRTAREMSHGRSAFRMIDDWGSLLREGQPNVVAAAAVLADRGYEIAPGTSPVSISAARTVFRIVGVMIGADSTATLLKQPADGARDLAQVLTVVEAIPAEDGDQHRRFSSLLLTTIAEIIEDNPQVEIDRLGKAVGTKTVKEWLQLAKAPGMGGRKYMRDNICFAYNKGPKRDDRKIA